MALVQEKRHDEQSAIVARLITDKVRANPTFTSPSPATAPAADRVWALEKLPEDVIIDKLVMMQSAYPRV